MTITMQSTGLSSLSPRFVLYNGSMQGIVIAAAPNTYGSTVSYTVPSVSPGDAFYIRAMAASGGATSAGAYGLQINFGGGTMAPFAPPNTTVSWTFDQGFGSSSDSVDPSSHGRSQDHGRHKGHGNNQDGSDDAQLVSIGNLSGVADKFTVGSLPVGPSPTSGGWNAVAMAAFGTPADPTTGLIGFTLDAGSFLPSLSQPSRDTASLRVLDSALQNL